MKTLLEAGANIEAQNNEGETALEIARRIGNPKCVKILEAYIEAQENSN